METLDPDLLRTFLAFADGGSLAHAASTVGRTPSAITAQMQRLQELVGEPLIERAGRGRVLTPAGEDLALHARRILAVHREAWLALKGARAGGEVRLAATQDFLAAGLPDLLRDFARHYPRVGLALRVGRTRELAAELAAGSIDVLVAMRAGPAADEVAVLDEPMLWLASADGLIGADEPLPLALLDPPCGFRDAGLAALNRIGRPFRFAATSPNLAGLMAAVRAGLAVTVRTRRSLGPGIVAAPAALRLPALGSAQFSIRVRSQAGRAASDLGTLLAEGLAAAPASRRLAASPP